MIYEYSCPKCAAIFDVVKSVHEMDRVERCEKCDSVSIRNFIPRIAHFIGTKVEHPEYNPGLGCIVRNKDHRKELCKLKGVQEIGNESPEKLHKYYDKAREEKREQAWAEADRGWVGDGSS